jgi:hypothetical protein
LFDFSRSPARAAPNSAIIQNFWNDGETQRLPYLRGRLVAFMIDRANRKKPRAAPILMM